MKDNNSPKKILVTGANGQLGREFRDLAGSFSGYEFLFAAKDELDIADAAAVNIFFKNNAVAVCINCAAYTAVDKAETESYVAERINSIGPANLAAACRDKNAGFIHISTDYVFNGKSFAAYLPGDATDPVNAYGRTKAAGEENARKENPAAVIIRTAWVYSSYGNNFLKTMIRLMNEKDSINVVSDQQGSPTYAADLAGAIMGIISKNDLVPGIYHYTNEGITSWYGFAKEIAEQTDSNCIVNPINTDQYPTPAVRPAWSVLDTQKIKDIYGISIPGWQDSLRRCIAKMK